MVFMGVELFFLTRTISHCLHMERMKTPSVSSFHLRHSSLLMCKGYLWRGRDHECQTSRNTLDRSVPIINKMQRRRSAPQIFRLYVESAGLFCEHQWNLHVVIFTISSGLYVPFEFHIIVKTVTSCRLVPNKRPRLSSVTLN